MKLKERICVDIVEVLTIVFIIIGLCLLFLYIKDLVLAFDCVAYNRITLAGREFQCREIVDPNPVRFEITAHKEVAGGNSL